ncbi:MAG: malto-oligosyltrehalose trehalohydrolase [Oligoflexia bacterium]|nr:malto-oligosyltrehalose trehalohydrolase [Oligoflexia bacterium]
MDTKYQPSLHLPPVGAELLFKEKKQKKEANAVKFRVWAPKRKKVEVIISRNGSEDLITSLSEELAEAEMNGYFSGIVEGARPGDLYQYRLDGHKSFPDPASRFQPQGVHGPSQIVDPTAYIWNDHSWKGITELQGQVIYEMHIGTFTKEGNWSAAATHLLYLFELGVTVIEVMPVAEFPGKFGWGYDGVYMYAPTHLYGSPDDFRRFIDEAHRLGMGVILDVVYNHLGPDGNYFRNYSDYYFSNNYKNEWGDAINFDGDHSQSVRDYFSYNAAYWVDEFHLDGLRLDATQQIFDSSSEHILTLINKRAKRAAKTYERDIILLAENERQEAKLVRTLEKGGYGLDGIWNDDFHHSARVVLTGKNEAYYTDYLGNSQELLSAVKWGFLFQGQRYKWQKARRGHYALDLQPQQFITFLENHDQVANSLYGRRLLFLTSPSRYRALTALLLLSPGTPMIFQGQEFGSSSPFLFFADHHKELSLLVAKGRGEFMRQFSSITVPEVFNKLVSPHDPKTFECCKLDHSERQKNTFILQLHKDLLRLRREEPAFNAKKRRGYDGAILSDQALVLRFFIEDDITHLPMDLLLIVNWGRDTHLDPAPEPLLAPPEGMHWSLLWTSEDIKYDGAGTPALDTADNWLIAGETAVVLIPTQETTQGVSA